MTDLNSLIQVDLICDEFDSAWRSQRRPRLEDFVQRVGGESADVLFEELLHIELDHRRNLREEPVLADYDGRFPQQRELLRKAFPHLQLTVEAGRTQPTPQGLSQVEHVAGDTVGPYRLIRPMGQGAFGRVWLAERTGKLATTQVALKFPLANDRALQLIRTEAQSWVRASGHPNIVP